MSQPAYKTVSDVASYFAVSPRTVERWIERGELSTLRVGPLRISGALKGAVGDHLALNSHPAHLELSRLDLSDADTLFLGQPGAPACIGFLVDHGRLSH